MMWEKMAQMVQELGSQVALGADVTKVLWTDNKVQALEICKGEVQELVSGSHFISSMPIRELIQKFDPKVPEPILKAAFDLKYRDFILVALVVNQPRIFADQWIYVHDNRVKVGRIQNFKNWSKDMVPDPNKSCLGMEYFCFEGDGLWNMADGELIELAKRELEMLGLSPACSVDDGTVVRMPKAYPVYDSTYAGSLQVIREFLSRLTNLQLVGRNGMHKYNNQDHSMLAAMLAVRNILGADYDLWAVNADPEYHEHVGEQSQTSTTWLLASTQPRVPIHIKRESPS
jgi:protoporphyrinogen oxidase